MLVAVGVSVLSPQVKAGRAAGNASKEHLVPLLPSSFRSLNSSPSSLFLARKFRYLFKVSSPKKSNLNLDLLVGSLLVLWLGLIWPCVLQDVFCAFPFPGLGRVVLLATLADWLFLPPSSPSRCAMATSNESQITISSHWC